MWIPKKSRGSGVDSNGINGEKRGFKGIKGKSGRILVNQGGEDENRRESRGRGREDQ